MRGSSRPRHRWRYAGLLVLVLLAAALVPMAVQAAKERPISSEPVTSITPSPGSPVTVFIGDSSVRGAGATRDSGRWSSIAANVLDWEEVNLARTGSGYGPTTAGGGCDGRSRCRTYVNQIEAVRKKNPTLVVVGGGHAAAGPASRTNAPVLAFYRALHTALPDAQIIAVGPWTARPTEEKSVAVLDEAVQKSARSVSAVYVSLLDPKPLDSSMTTGGGKALNDIGHQAVADRIVSAINEGPG